MAQKQKIIIIGGGFGGVRCAKDLARFLNDQVEIVLIDQNDYQLYYPALYEVATATKDSAGAWRLKNTATLPLEAMLKNTGGKIIQGVVERIDLASKLVVVDGGEINFDWLVVSAGSKEEFYEIPGAQQYTHPLKSFSQCIHLRNLTEQRIQEVGGSSKEVRFVIAGGGFAATEFAGELRNYLLKLAKKYSVPKESIKLAIVEGAFSLLPGLNPKVSALAQKRLASFDISFKFNSRITEVGENYLILSNGEKLSADLIVWAAGVRGCGDKFGLSFVDQKGRFSVDSTLRLKENQNTFVIGDVNCFVNEQVKKPLPQLAQVAIGEGRYVASTINKIINNLEVASYKPSNYGFIIPVSGKYAIFCSANGHIIISGFLGWSMRRFADLRYFLSVLPFWFALKIWWSENILYIKNDQS